MNENKLIITLVLAAVVIAMATSNQLSIYASPMTEDDGYTYPDDATEEEQEEIDEREQEAWEDAGRPGELDNDDNNNSNGGNDNELPIVQNAPAPEVRSTSVNESRWYENCVGGGEQDGGWLTFNTLIYQNCGTNVNGDKGYYDGFVQGCMGIDSTNTKELCEAFIVGCLRAQSVDSSETCDVSTDTSSAEWKIVMTPPSYTEG